MSFFSSETMAPYLLLILFGFLPSEVWRFFSAFMARGINEDSEIFVWVRAVATALLAGVVARLVMSPSGALAMVPLLARLGALGVGVAAFAAFRKSVFAAVIAGEIAIIAAGFYWV